MKTPRKGWRRSGRQCVMAVVLGTALAAAGSAAEQTRTESTSTAIQDISRYCSACWRNARLPVDSWSDCTQEVFRRLLERVAPEDWHQLLGRDDENRRELVRAIDAVKKHILRQRHAVGYAEEMSADRRDLVERGRADEREVFRQAADLVLTPRQQRILQLSCEGCSIAEIAGELAVSTDRISDEKYKSIRKLREHFATHPEWVS